MNTAETFHDHSGVEVAEHSVQTREEKRREEKRREEKRREEKRREEKNK
jgi:hypothetical protein